MADDSPSITERLPFLINRVGTALATGFAAEALVERNLTIPIYRVLSVLSDHGPMRQVDVVDLTSIESSTLSRLVGRMVRRGLVSRSRSHTSDREVMLRLSAKGASTLEPLRATGLKFDTIAMEGLSPKEIEALKRYLRHIYGNITAARARNRGGLSRGPGPARPKRQRPADRA